MKQRTLPYILFILLAAFLMGGTAVLALTERASGNGGGEYTINAPQAPQTCPATLRIMPLGDSITVGINSTGNGTGGAGAGYREPLFDSLTASGYTFDFVGKETAPDVTTPGFDNDNDGHSSIQTQAVAAFITARLTNFPADVVLIHLGTNDVGSGDTASTDLNTLLNGIDLYESNESTHVTAIVAQIINRPCDGGSGCSSKSADTSTLNDNIATLVQARVTAGDDIRLINMEDDIGFDYSAASADFTYPADGLHPSNAGYAKMAAAWDSELDAYISGGCAGATSPTPPIITTTAGTTATAGQSYTYDVDATGDPTITYSLTITPTGMTINSSSGLISWTPTNGQAGSNSVTVQASNSGGSDTESFTIIVDAPPNITSWPTTNALVGTEYSYQLQATGSPAPTYSLVTAPSGMSMDANGLVTWTPTGGQVGIHDVTVQATNGIVPVDTQDFTITVSSAPAAPIITSSPSTSSTPGVAYSYQVQATGFPQATFGLTVKPTGMSIDSGIITWTPGVGDAGNSVSVTVTATNSEGSDLQSFSIDVNYVLYLPLVVNP